MYIWRHTCDVHPACTWYLHEWSLTTTYIPVMHIGFKSMSHRKYYSSYMWTLSSCHTICRAAMPLSDYLIILWLHFLVKRCYVRVCVCVCVCVHIICAFVVVLCHCLTISLSYYYIFWSNVVVRSVCTVVNLRQYYQFVWCHCGVIVLFIS